MAMEWAPLEKTSRGDPENHEEKKLRRLWVTVVSELQKNNDKTERNGRQSLESTVMTDDIHKCTDIQRWELLLIWENFNFIYTVNVY